MAVSKLLLYPMQQIIRSIMLMFLTHPSVSQLVIQFHMN